MDPVRGRPRVWILPAMFALVVLSLPAQLYIDARVGQPYPGLFQPTFGDVPGHDRAVKYRAVVLEADGQVVEEETLFPGTNSGRRQRLLEAMFPPQGGSPHVDAATRARMRSWLADALDARPHILAVTWERRRFDLDTRRTSVIRTLVEYRIDLTEGDR